MTRRATFYAYLASALLIGLPLSGVGAQTTEALNVGDPYNGPAIVFSSTPDVALIPGTRIHYIRNSDYDMFRAGGRWYYRYDGCWYQGASYNGPFKFVTAVPRGVRAVSPRYRHSWTTASNASASKARVQSRHASRTTGYSK